MIGEIGTESLPCRTGGGNGHQRVAVREDRVEYGVGGEFLTGVSGGQCGGGFTVAHPPAGKGLTLDHRSGEVVHHAVDGAQRSKETVSADEGHGIFCLACGLFLKPGVDRRIAGDGRRVEEKSLVVGVVGVPADEGVTLFDGIRRLGEGVAAQYLDGGDGTAAVDVKGNGEALALEQAVGVAVVEQSEYVALQCGGSDGIVTFREGQGQRTVRVCKCTSLFSLQSGDQKGVARDGEEIFVLSVLHEVDVVQSGILYTRVRIFSA